MDKLMDKLMDFSLLLLLLSMGFGLLTVAVALPFVLDGVIVDLYFYGE